MFSFAKMKYLSHEKKYGSISVFMYFLQTLPIESGVDCIHFHHFVICCKIKERHQVYLLITVLSEHALIRNCLNTVGNEALWLWSDV